MFLLNLWSSKARDEIRAITFGDVNQDGLNEVIYASWDGSIYVLNSLSGNRIWVPTLGEIQGPAENVEIVETVDGPIILASVYKYIVALDAKNRKILWSSNLEGWVNTLRKVDIDDDGEDEIVAQTLSGETIGIDTNGEKIWVREGSEVPIQGLLEVLDLNLDGEEEIIKIGKKPNIVEILSNDGGLITSYKFSNNILALRKINLGVGGGIGAIFSTHNSIGLILQDGYKLKKYRKSFKPYILECIDIDNDGVDEILVGDWETNTVKIYSINLEEEPFLKETGKISLKGNPMFIAETNLQGDNKKQIIIGVKGNDGSSERVLVYTDGKKALEIPWFGSFKGYAIGKVLRENVDELIVRTGREEITMFVAIPRIGVPEYITEGESFEVYVWSQANYALEATKSVKILDKKDSTRKKYGKIGYIIKTTYLLRSIRSGKGRLKLVKGKKTELIKDLNVYSKKEVLDGRTPIIIYQEDRLKAEKNVDITAIEKEAKLLSINKRKSKDKIILDISSPITGNISFKNKIKLEALVKKPIKVKIIEKEFLKINDKLTLDIENLSRKTLAIELSISDPIEAETVTEKIPPNSKKKIDINIEYQPEDFKEEVKATIYINYRGLKQHQEKIPIKLLFINDKKIKQLAKELEKTTKNKEKILEALKEKTKLTKEQLKKIL